MKNLKERKLNNNGFSLVELIIVIAIMAVLVGVLAPQYLKYVERSREAADVSSIDEMISAVEIYSADPSASVVTGKLTCSSGTISADGAVASGSPAAGTVAAALEDAGITSLPTMKSTAYQDWEIEFAASSVTISDANLKTALGR